MDGAIAAAAKLTDVCFWQHRCDVRKAGVPPKPSPADDYATHRGVDHAHTVIRVRGVESVITPRAQPDADAPGPRIRYAPLNFRKTIRERFPAAVLPQYTNECSR